ncbi:hypothetical protein [Solimonas terrae]|uniref:Uncharacterized protein n=1 Tax=Solimonas terrae TaxID=1396819 RepID=A0A6M2BQZ3_9GAMM|nr:hypothetical protein [Solimonas terrae]NGY04740.1 hypothetical protein [Solimonas terrae]
MGMYTELVLKADVKRDLPREVEAVLQHLFNGEECPKELPQHRFFECERWEHIGSMSSYYHIPWAVSRYHDGRIFSRSDLKNYDGEIAAFVSWLMPYLDEPDGKCIGWSWYEEGDTPELLLMTPN